MPRSPAPPLIGDRSPPVPSSHPAAASKPNSATPPCLRPEQDTPPPRPHHHAVSQALQPTTEALPRALEQPRAHHPRALLAQRRNRN
jgi:hypothetical protein